MKQVTKLFLGIILIGTSSFLSAQQSKAIKNCYSIECLKKNIKTVESLTLDQKSLSEFPREILKAKNLRQLSLLNTSIDKIPDSISELKKLEYVRLEKNKNLKQKELFSQLAKIPSLQTLDLSKNGWFYLSNDIGKLKGLKSLTLSSNYIEDLPRELFTEIQLTELALSSNKIKNLPPEIQLSASLKKLDVSYNKKLNLRGAIEYFEMIPSLENLTLGHVERAPKSIKNLQQLKQLSVREGNCNNVIEHSSKIGGLESLEILYPQSDIKSKETEKLSELKNLNSLRINSFNSVDVSSSTLNLPKLSNLDLQANELLVGELDSNRTPELKNLKVSNSTFSKKQETLLTESLSGLEKLEISSTEGINSIDLSTFDSLKDINFAYSEMDLSAIDFNLDCEVKQLNIIGNTISNEDLNILQTSYSTARLVSPNTYKDIGKDLVSKPEKIDVKEMKNETEFSYQPRKENSIKTKSGYKIDIPKNAFVDKNGNPIDKQVKVKVTTYDSPLEIALAGIPMTYNENEEPQFFSSSSMFKIETEDGNQNIRINPNAPLQASMPVDRNSDTLYQLNSNTGLWEKVAPPNLRTLTSAQIMAVKVELESDPDFKVPNRPTMPEDKSKFERITLNTKKEKDKGSFSFTIFPQYNPLSLSKNYKKFYQVRQIKRHTWHYDGNNSEADMKAIDSLSKYLKRYYTKKVNKKTNNLPRNSRPSVIRSVELIPNIEKDNFTMRILVGNRTLDIPCYPEINPKNHDMEAKRIRGFYKGYMRVEKRKNRAWGKIDNRYNSKIDNYNDKNEKYSSAMEVYNKEFQKRLVKRLGATIADSLAYMSEEDLAAALISIPIEQKLQVLGFGTFNCDVIYRYREPVQFKGTLVAENGTELSPKNIIIMDKSQNGTFTTQWKKKFMYDARGKVAIMAKLDNGMLAYVSSQEMSELDLKKANKLTMKIIDPNQFSFKEIESLL